jgi:peptide deformylase
MAILDIRVLGDPILREQTREVTEITDEIRTLIDNMFETMYAAEGIGLAAPQVGRHERITVIDVDDEQYVLINPEITSRSGKARDDEGCLSIPEISGSVERATEVTVRALDREGNTIEIEATDLLARCIQHEVDHLDGKLFIDYLSVLKRRSAARKWEKEVTKYPNFVRTLEPPEPGAKRRRSRGSHTPSDHEPEL